MIEHYQSTERVTAEQFDGSKQMMEKYKIIKQRRGPHDYTMHAYSDIGIDIGDYILIGNPGEYSSMSKYVFELRFEKSYFDPIPLSRRKGKSLLFEQASLL